MNFKLKIKVNETSAMHVVYRESRRGGLDLIDRARRLTGIHNLRAGSVDDFVPCFIEMDVDIHVDEKTARESGLFATSSEASIVVPEHSLNKYVVEEPYLDLLRDTIIIRWKTVLQTQRIVEDWIAAGYPVEWNA